MSDPGAFQRARLWLGQGRADRAEPELRRALVEEPERAVIHALLALCLVQLERLPEALEEARHAVQAEPDDAFAHYSVAVVQAQRGRIAEAREAVVEAIRLDPEDPDSWALKGQIELNDRRWDDALEAAERGLALNGEHVDGANVRAVALQRLGRADEADAAMRQVLARDPENAASHVNEGWRRLHRREVREAADHFREALRLDPDNEPARGGMIEAIKAKNRLYRAMLSVFLWMGSQSRRTVWLILILIWLAPKFLRVVARDHPELRPVLVPVIVALVGFVYLSWIIDPLFDMMLFWHPLGRYALNRSERLRAVLVTACLGTALAAGLIGLAWAPGAPVAVLLLLFVIPLSAALGVEKPRGRRRVALAMLAVLGLLVACILVTGTLAFGGGSDSWMVIVGMLMLLYLLGSFALAILANRWAMSVRTD